MGNTFVDILTNKKVEKNEELSSPEIEIVEKNNVAKNKGKKRKFLEEQIQSDEEIDILENGGAKRKKGKKRKFVEEQKKITRKIVSPQPSNITSTINLKQPVRKKRKLNNSSLSTSTTSPLEKKNMENKDSDLPKKKIKKMNTPRPSGNISSKIILPSSKLRKKGKQGKMKKSSQPKIMVAHSPADVSSTTIVK